MIRARTVESQGPSAVLGEGFTGVSQGPCPDVVGTVPVFPLPGITPLGGLALPGVGAESRLVAVVERCLLPGVDFAVSRPPPLETPLPGPSL
jgi:hypothetical protein